MKRVLFFLPSLGNGGAESHALRVLNHLDRTQFEPSVALGRTDGSYQHLLEDHVTVHHVSSHRVSSSTARMALAAIPLRQLVQREQPDVVCSFMEAANIVAASTLPTIPHRPSLVLVVQAPPTRNFAGAQRALVLDGIRRLYPRADAIISLSHGVARDLVSIEPSLSSRIQVIHNACVDAPILAAANIERPLRPSSPRPIVFACGRLVPQKGFGVLLDAFSVALRTIDAELWIAGEGPLRGALSRRISDLQLGGRVPLLGFQAAPQWLMARADLFVLSSVFEGFGNVLVEAMAVGTPVVSTDCPFGPDEILTDGVDGLLVPVGDPHAIASAICRLLGDDALRARVGAAGQRRATDFHAEVIAKSYGELFDTVVRTRP